VADGYDGRKQLRSAVGKRKVERVRNGAFNEVESERNDAAEPQTEASACGVNQESSARDERGRCGAEQAMSRGEQGRDGSVWSAATPALVTARDRIAPERMQRDGSMAPTLYHPRCSRHRQSGSRLFRLVQPTISRCSES
jgi:hypothetical protein